MFLTAHGLPTRPTRPATATALWAAEHATADGAATVLRTVLKPATRVRATAIHGA